MKSLGLVALALFATPSIATVYDFPASHSITFTGGTYILDFGAQLTSGTSGSLYVILDVISPKFDPRLRPPCFIDPTCNDVRQQTFVAGNFELSDVPGSFRAIPRTQSFDIYSYNSTTFYFTGDGGARIDVPDAFLLAAPIPEPASWTMMIAGFALVGSGLRRRKQAVSFG